MFAKVKTRTKVIAAFGATLVIALIVFIVSYSCRVPDLRFEPNELMAPFNGGREALDYVLAHAETMSSINLLVGANTAYRLGRLQDAAFLFKAGRIRARYDLQKYKPKATGGDSPEVFLDFLEVNASGCIIPDIFLRPQDYAKTLERLEAWRMKEPTEYDPDWEYTRQDVPADLASKLKAAYLDDEKQIATLLNIPQYFEAYKVMRAADELPPEKRADKAVAERRSKAEQTMRRVEKEMNLKGFIYRQGS